MNYITELLSGIWYLIGAVVQVAYPYILTIIAWELLKKVWRVLAKYLF